MNFFLTKRYFSEVYVPEYVDLRNVRGCPLFRKKWLNNLCVRVGVRAYLCVRSLISHLNLIKCEPIIIKLYMDILI